MRVSDWVSDVCPSDLQMARDPAGGGGLVIKTFVKADGESLDRLSRLGLHHGDDQRGIDAAGKARAQRHIGDHPLRDCMRSEERRVGEECVRTGRYRW